MECCLAICLIPIMAIFFWALGGIIEMFARAGFR